MRIKKMKRFLKTTALCIAMTLLVTLFCISAQALSATDSKTIISSGSVGTGTGKQTTVVDFSTSNLNGFEALGNVTEPTFTFSENWQTNVLSTRIDSAQKETGIRGTLANASLLQSASTLSVRLLAQYAKTTTYTLTLRLEGTDKTGAPLSLESTASVPTTYWKTVTFDISSFVASANLDAPCTMTILTSSDAESEEFVLWVHSIYTCSLEAYPEFLIPVVCSVGGLIVGFTLFFVIYRATCRKNRRRRQEEGR